MSPNIPAEGLIMFVDAANPRSYPGTGNTWYDISGSNNHMTLVNGVAYSTVNGGVMQTDGTNDYIVLSPFDLRTTDHTIMAASRYSGATRGRIISSMNNNWLLAHWNAQSTLYYAEGWIVPPTGSGNVTDWIIPTAVENYSVDTWTIYKNGSFLASNSSGSSGPLGLCFGGWSGSGEFSAAEISLCIIYNRLLSAQEIKQCYNAIKRRFAF